MGDDVNRKEFGWLSILKSSSVGMLSPYLILNNMPIISINGKSAATNLRTHKERKDRTGWTSRKTPQKVRTYSVATRHPQTQIIELND